MFKFFKNFLGHKKTLSVFLFHHIFRDGDEAERASMDVRPQMIVTVGDLADFIVGHIERGFRFVSESQVLSGLEEGNHILITFDDGYYNNSLALPVLEKYSVPATFFITSGNVLSGKGFWWDTLWRERIRGGIKESDIAKERQVLKSMRSNEIDSYLIKEFGSESLFPKSNADRPFTAKELSEFSKSSLISVGNHTHSHAILTNYDARGAREEIARAKKELQDIIKRPVRSLAYPNGNHSRKIVSMARELGFELGFTTKEHRNNLSPNFKAGNRNLMLGRFVFKAQN